MLIFDQKKREAQKQGTFMVHLWSFLTKKSAKRKNKEHLYLILCHFWLKKLTFVES